MVKSRPHMPVAGATLPLKDALRLLRHTMRVGRARLGEPPTPVPPPVDMVARRVLDEVDHVAGQINALAAGLSHRLLDAGPVERSPTLEEIVARADPALSFAAAAYRGTTRALRLLGACDGLVSETRAAEAFHAALQETGPGDRYALAAAIADGFGRRHVVVNVLALPETAPEGLSDVEIGRLAIFAVMLWLLADRLPEDEDPDGLLAAACAMARALSGELSRAGWTREAVGALLRAYAEHI